MRQGSMRGWWELKDVAKLYEGVELQQRVAFGRGVERRVFQHPCVFVEEEDSMQSCGEGGVDVALDAVADHPACVRRELVAGDDFAVSGRVFFLYDFNRVEVSGKPG